MVIVRVIQLKAYKMRVNGVTDVKFCQCRCGCSLFTGNEICFMCAKEKHRAVDDRREEDEGGSFAR